MNHIRVNTVYYALIRCLQLFQLLVIINCIIKTDDMIPEYPKIKLLQISVIQIHYNLDSHEMFLLMPITRLLLHTDYSSVVIYKP